MASAFGWVGASVCVCAWYLLSIGCLVSVEYLDSALIQIIVPTVLLVLAAVAFAVFSKKGDEKKAGLCAQFLVVFTFLIYMSTSNKVSATPPLPGARFAPLCVCAHRASCVLVCGPAASCCGRKIFSILNCKLFADGPWCG